MPKFLYVLVVLFLLSPALSAQISIIPKPVSLEPGTRVLQWKKSVTVVAKNADEKKVASLLQEFFKTKGLSQF